jgi:hypothetical protein
VSRASNARRELRRAAVRGSDRAGVALLPGSVAAISTGTIGSNAALGYATVANTVTTAVGGAAATLSAFGLARLQRANAVLTEITLTYLATGDRQLLDELFGRLIGGAFQKEDFKPTQQFFRALSKVVADGDYWISRRLVEALPALFELDRKATLSLLHTIRASEYDTRFRDDLRRRALEALALPLATGSDKMILARLSDKELLKLLSPVPGDQVWTDMAVLEVAAAAIANAGDDDSRARRKMEEQLQHIADSITARSLGLRELWPGAKSAFDGDAESALRTATTLAASPDVDSRTAAGRLCVLIVRHDKTWRDAGAVLALQAKLAEDPDRYVRRPLAREVNVRYLLRALSSQDQIKAQALLLRLATDDDAIIPLTIFDIIETCGLRSPLLAPVYDALQNAFEADERLVARVATARANVAT